MINYANTISYHISDISFIEGHSKHNLKKISEVQRIQIHLRYVINKLNKSDISFLNDSQKRARKDVIKKLSIYCENGKFPKHEKLIKGYKRKPRFIDHNGTHCAIGHLMKVTGYQNLAKEINNEFEYDYVKNIKKPEMLEWAKKHGLTVEECAMIQPAYSISNSLYISAILDFNAILYCKLLILSCSIYLNYSCMVNLEEVKIRIKKIFLLIPIYLIKAS